MSRAPLPRLLKSSAILGILALCIAPLGCGGGGGSKSNNGASSTAKTLTLNNNPSVLPAFVAFQDGNGAWSKVTVSATMTFQVTDPAGRYGVAVGQMDGPDRWVDVFQYTHSECPVLNYSLINGSATPIRISGYTSGLPSGWSSRMYGRYVLSTGGSVSTGTGAAPYYFYSLPGSFDCLKIIRDSSIRASAIKSYPLYAYTADTDMGTDSYTAGTAMPSVSVQLTGLASGESLWAQATNVSENRTAAGDSISTTASGSSWSTTVKIAPAGILGANGYKYVYGRARIGDAYRTKSHYFVSGTTPSAQSLVLPSYVNGQTSLLSRTGARIVATGSEVIGAKYYTGYGVQDDYTRLIGTYYYVSTSWLAGAPSQSSYQTPDLSMAFPPGSNFNFTSGYSIDFLFSAGGNSTNRLPNSSNFQPADGDSAWSAYNYGSGAAYVMDGHSHGEPAPPAVFAPAQERRRRQKVRHLLGDAAPVEESVEP